MPSLVPQHAHIALAPRLVSILHPNSGFFCLKLGMSLPAPLVPTCGTSPWHTHTQQLPPSQHHLLPQYPSWVLPDTLWLWKNLVGLRTEGSGQFWVSSGLFMSTRQARGQLCHGVAHVGDSMNPTAAPCYRSPSGIFSSWSNTFFRPS